MNPRRDWTTGRYIGLALAPMRRKGQGYAVTEIMLDPRRTVGSKILSVGCGGNVWRYRSEHQWATSGATPIEESQTPSNSRAYEPTSHHSRRGNSIGHQDYFLPPQPPNVKPVVYRRLQQWFHNERMLRPYKIVMYDRTAPVSG